MHETITLPDAVQRSLDPQLEAEECVLWVGRPNPWRYAKARGDSSPVFSALWTALWTAILLVGPNSTFFADGVHWAFYLFPAMGIFSLLWPLVLHYQAHSVFYAVTNRRALIFEVRRNVSITSFYPRDIVGFTCLGRKDGYGDIVLRAEPYTGSHGDEQFANYGFFGIPDPDHVEALVRPLALSSEEKLQPKEASGFNFPLSIAEWKRDFGLRQR
ncbi:MAG: hypothetical protein ABL962_11290 [Fimbriimonadaceae bacterium]